MNNKIKNKWMVINNFKNIINNTYAVNYIGDVINLKTNKLLHKKIANKKKHPYYAVNLKRNDGTSEWFLVHQLVANYFVKIPKELKNHPDLVPDHLDNNGLNNHYKNLQWKTRGKNVSDAFKMNYINNSGENNKNTFITEKEARKICKLLEKNYTYDEIIYKMKFPNNKKYKKLLVRIKNGLAWKKVSSEFNFNKKEYKYTDKQLDTLKRIPLILSLYEKGYSTKEIFNVVYKEEKCNKDTKMNIIRRVCKHKIFENEISQIIKDTRSTTIES